MTWEDSEHYPKRVEMAHGSLLSACGTLAKVKRCKMPDVFAVVNVAPSAGPVMGHAGQSG